LWATVPLRFVLSFLYIVLILIIFRGIKFRNYHLKNAVFRKNKYTWLYLHTTYHCVLLLHLVFFRWFMKEWRMCFFSFDKYYHFVMLFPLVLFLPFRGVAKLSHAQFMNYVLQQIITVQPYYWSKSYLEIKILRIMLLPVSLPSGKWKSDHYNASWSENWPFYRPKTLFFRNFRLTLETLLASNNYIDHCLLDIYFHKIVKNVFLNYRTKSS
jgi:hypothetical protein